VTTVSEIATAALAELEAIPNLVVFDNDVPELTAVQRDGQGNAKPYAVLWTSGGGVRRSDRLAYAALDLSAGFTVTCAAGTPGGARWAVDKVRARLTGLRLLGVNHGFLKEVLDDPGPIRKDKDVPSEIRWFLALPYRIATSA